MGRKEWMIRKVADHLDLPAEPLPGVPVAELWGSSRVLVENHRGVKGYNTEEIQIGVNYGILKVSGSGLQLTLMTTDQLIITGEIRALTVERRESC